LAVTALTAANVFAAGAVDSKTGAYLGGNLGLANTNVKYDYKNLNVSASKPYRQQNTKFESGKMNPLFGLFAGYGMQVGTMYFGGEVYGGFDSAKVSPFDDSGSANNTGFWKTTVKRTNFYGIAPRLGFFVAPSTMMYVKLGIEGGKWKATINPNAGTIDSYTGGTTSPTSAQKEASKLATNSSKNSISFVPAVGFDMFVSKSLFIRAEYSYMFGPKLSFVQNTTGYNNDLMDGDSVRHNVKITQQTFKVGVGYKF